MVTLALVLLLGCRRGDGGAPPMPEVPLGPRPLARLDGALIEGARGALEALAQAARAGDEARVGEILAGPDGDGVGDRDGDEPRALVLEGLAAGMEVSLEAGWPALTASLGGAAVTTLAVRLRSPWDGGLASDRWDGVIHVALEASGWRVRPSLRWAAPAARLEQVRADLWIDPAREWIVVDAALALDAGAAGAVDLGPVAIELPPHLVPGRAPLDTRPRVRLLEVSQDGAACAFQSSGEVLLIEPARPPAPGERLRLRIRYEGEIATDVDQFVRDPYLTAGDQAQLARALPRQEGHVVEHEVVVHHPDGTDVIGAAPATASGVGPRGWRWDRLSERSAGTFRVYLTRQRTLPRRAVRAGGLTVEIDGELEGLEAILGRAVAALAPLGDWPAPAVRFVAYARPNDGAPEGELSGTTILLDWPAATAAGEVRTRLLVTHELAHLWFGGAVAMGGDERMWWWESIASYVALWALDDAEYATLIDAWRAQVRELEPSRRPGAADARTRSYFQGALVLVELERRLGRSVVAAALRRMIDTRRGRIGVWQDLIASVAAEAGAAESRWLRTALAWNGQEVALALRAPVGGTRAPVTAAVPVVAIPRAAVTPLLPGAASTATPPIAVAALLAPDALILPGQAAAARARVETALPSLEQARAPRVAGVLRTLTGFTAPVAQAEAYWTELVGFGYATLSTEAGDLDFALGGRHVGIVRVADAEAEDRATRLEIGAVHADGDLLAPGLPWDLIAASRTVAVSGALWIDPARHWLVGDVTVRIATAAAAPGEPLVMRFLPVRTPSDGDGWQHRGVRVTDISQDGDGCPWQSYRDILVVQPARAAAEVVLRLRYQGEVDALPEDWMSPDEVRLGRAFPIIAGSAPSIDAVVHVPSGAALEGPRPPSVAGDGPAGWRWARFHAVAAAALPLYVHRGALRELVVDAGGLRVTVASAAEGAGAALAPLLAPVLAALAPLGPPPVRHLRLVAAVQYLSDQPDAMPAALGETVVIPWTAAGGAAAPSGAVARQRIARTLARLWFGGLVPPAGHAAAAWWDALAGYVALWALSADEALAVRQGWLAALSSTRAALPAPRDLSLPPPAVAGLLASAAAPLALVALEDRIGRAAMVDALQLFLATRRGLPSTWDDLLAAIALASSPADAFALAAWLDQPGLVDLQLRAVRVSDGILLADLVQLVDDPAAGIVDVALYRGDRRVGGGRVEFAAEVLTSIRLPAPPGVDRVVLDPEARLPHRLDQLLGPLEGGTEVALVVPDR